MKMGNNPTKKEYTHENKNSSQLFTEKELNFLVSLDRDITGFTGKYMKIADNKYSLETFIYKTPDFYNQVGLEFDSKNFLDKNPDKTIELLYILEKEFWNKGWIHGDLDTSNIVIQYEDNKTYFRIFDFEEIQYESPRNKVGFFKFIWSDIRKFMKEYLDLFLVKNTKTKKCYWLYKEHFFSSNNNIEYYLCNIIDMDSNKNINVSKSIKEILNFLDRFSVYKYLYSFTNKNKDNSNFEVVHDKMILSKDD